MGAKGSEVAFIVYTSHIISVLSLTTENKNNHIYY